MSKSHYTPVSPTEETDITFPWQHSPGGTEDLNPTVTADMVQLLDLQAQPQTFYDYWIQPVTLTAGTHPTQGRDSTGYYVGGRRFGGILYSSAFREGIDDLVCIAVFFHSRRAIYDHHMHDAASFI